MSIPSTIRLGKLTQQISQDAAWWGDGVFIGNQIFADFIEEVLCHLNDMGQFESYKSSLRGKRDQRDGALAEAYCSFFFKLKGFEIKDYWPDGKENRKLDLEVQWEDTRSIHVEVKGPTWRGELSDDERKSGRKGSPKDVSSEARSVDPSKEAGDAIEKAIEKFPKDTTNLVVVVQDTFMKPSGMIPEIFLDRIDKRLALPSMRILGGVLFLERDCKNGVIYIKSFLFENEHAIDNVKLPKEAIAVLSESNEDYFF